MKKHLTIIVFILMVIGFANGQTIRYVTPSGGVEPQDGTSWDNAYDGTKLQTAINETGVTQVWVAAGIYKPPIIDDPELDPRMSSFNMQSGVAIYGGFQGSESALSERDWATHATTLSGNIDNTNYSYHVVYNSDMNNTAVLDGFTIQDGSADGSNSGEDYGGGMYNINSSPTITNCAISWNSAISNGGGMYNEASSPLLTNCTFEGNNAAYGGGIYNTLSSSPVLLDCKIFNGWVYQSGGGMYNESSSSPSLTNCVLKDNTASNSGGGVYNNTSSPMLTSCTISGNTCQYGGGVYNLSSSPNLTNCQIKDNSTSYDGGGVFNSSSSPTLTNCLVINNASEDRGGGFWNEYSSSPILINCTVSGNSADLGGGMYNLLSSSPTINNSIIWGNTATTEGNQIFNRGDGGTITLNYCCYGNGSSDVVNYSTITPEEHCLNTDPKFKDAASADFRIFGNSPCADAGYNNFNSESTDIRGAGFGRKLSKMDGTPGTIDMGAYEYKFGTDPAVPQIIYVNASNAGGQDGLSWSTAYVSLQSALAEATGNTSIWVAAGTYKPTTEADPTIYFNLKNGVAIYGGFSGTGFETLLSQRDWKSNVTILSGDIGIIGNSSDNSGHVIYNNNVDNTAVLDGFTIQDGNAGIYQGGGMYNVMSSPTLANCSFTGNWGYLGGAISNYSSSPKLTNCTIKNNSAYNGGGFYNATSSLPILTNCLIANNMANVGGGGIFDLLSSSTLINSTIVNNASQWGGGVFTTDDASTTLSNSIIWGNTATTDGNQFCTNGGTITLNYSSYSNGTNDVYVYTENPSTFTATNHDITTDPKLLNIAGGDYRIAGNSPCIDFGLNSYNTEPFDIRGQARLQNTTIDMGAYEWTSDLDPINLVIYVDASKTSGANNGSSWADAYISLQSALTYALGGNQIWVAAGTYKPSATNNRFTSFSLKNDVAIYGGFAGTETSLSQRNWATHVTLLSGDIGTPGDNTDNSFHVIFNYRLNYPSTTALLDGFTIQGGNALGSPGYGGGVYNELSSPTLTNCIISGNTAPIGGGLYNYDHSSPTMINCLISGNSATGDWGGGVYNYYYSNPTLTNCTLSGNTSAKYGGGIVNNGICSPVINNSIIWGNTAAMSGNQIYIESGTTTMNKSCYSNGTGDVYIWSGGGGTFSPEANCITTDPKFVSVAGNDYRIFGNSPCKNTGYNAYNSTTVDIRGQIRIQNTTIDMGAYEWTSGVDPGEVITWTGTGVIPWNWNAADNWSPNTVPSAISVAIIPNVATDPFINENPGTPAVCYDLTIETGAVLTIAAGKALTVNGNLANSAGADGLVIKSDATGTGSLITSSTPSAKVERYVNAWETGGLHGWHLLSSPVSSQAISTAFTDATPANYDFYQWNEPANLWLNQKVGTNNITNFVPGTGYLVAYATAAIKQFTGTLNSADISISGLTHTSGAYAGWHLLGNPFPSALNLGSGNWAWSNITQTAKIWKESTAAYVDIPTAGGGIIPPMNGFMVETSGSGSLTIPAAARVHTATAWYKSTEGEIKLEAHDTDNNTAQESIVKVSASATEGFDNQYDSHFLAGYAPLFYSTAGSEQLSTNTLPGIDNERIILMEFVKNTGTNFSIELAENSITGISSVYLTDLKTGTVTNLSKTPTYSFTASESDDAGRFSLSFATTYGIDPEISSGMQVYTFDKTLFIAQTDPQKGTICIYTTTGQLVRSQSLESSTSQSICLQGFATGIYMVAIHTDKGMYNQKIVVK